ncbi:hypothetical protein MAMC_01660 [Methylacidimicrobium cyclopophantes]|uniref:Uncharacterized protein n=1 Tax=Methylacidimicrobium cyclopophantes TaxID=1041766 RepID=A0A5E6MND7_9BACT|nr:hypothetical protein [Methylacidimicrobium cyclopophantes]VVM07503.1 hypothetical protein MAMC_01660 [Methylacidimicrobium cyclopophantes]
MIYGRLLFPSWELALLAEARATHLAKACGLEEKEREEGELSRAMDGPMAFRGRSGASLVLSDLPNVSFEGIARKIQPNAVKPKITGGIGSNCSLPPPPMAGIPIHREALRGNRADHATLTGPLVTL